MVDKRVRAHVKLRLGGSSQAPRPSECDGQMDGVRFSAWRLSRNVQAADRSASCADAGEPNFFANSTVWLTRPFAPPRQFKKRAPRAVSEVKKFAQKAMGTSDVRIDQKLNKYLWGNGVKNVPVR